MFRRLLSFVLCLSLILSNVPVPAFAEENVPESTEVISENTEDFTFPTESVTEATEADVVPDPVPEEIVTEPSESLEEEIVEQTKPACTGLADCAAENHSDICEKKLTTMQTQLTNLRLKPSWK